MMYSYWWLQRYRDAGEGVSRPLILRVGGDPVPGVCVGLAQGILGMTIGGRRRITVSPDKASPGRQQRAEMHFLCCDRHPRTLCAVIKTNEQCVGCSPCMCYCPIDSRQNSGSVGCGRNGAGDDLKYRIRLLTSYLCYNRACKVSTICKVGKFFITHYLSCQVQN